LSCQLEPREARRPTHERARWISGADHPPHRAAANFVTHGNAVITIVGLALITLGTRAFFVLPEREWTLPTWLREALRLAPLAALIAVVVPEIVMSDGHLIHTWRDARLFAAAAGSAWFIWRRNLLGTIVIGTAVMVTLRVFTGW
jgi:branched-subunit amino acid transport protein